MHARMMLLAVATATALALRVEAAPGDLDPTFGTGGKVGATASGYAEGRALVLQPDGKIVVAGSDETDFALVRWNGDGTLDPTFGGDGIVTTPIGGVAEARALVRQPDGKLVAAGFTGASNGAENTWDFALVRYEEDGDLDPTFGSGGITVVDLTGDRDLANAQLGDPPATTDYAFCVYDESGAPANLIFEASVPAGGACGKGSCWKPPTSTGFKYRDSTRRRCGVGAMKVKSGVDGDAKIVLKARGEHLPVPALPLSVPLRAQLQAQTGACWEAIYSASGLVQNEATRFKAHSD